MKIHQIRKDLAALSLHRHELWQLHLLLLSIINAEGDGTDSLTKTAFEVDVKLVSILDLMALTEEEAR